jgi:hypothetical protein
MVHQSGMVFLKALIQATPQQKRAGFLMHLNKKMQEVLSLVPVTLYKNPLKTLTTFDRYLSDIHTSWLTPYLRTLTENDIRFFLAALSEPKRGEVMKSLRLSSPIPHLKQEARQFLQERLFAKVRAGKKNLLPLECLPDHPLNALLELTFIELTRLIDLAGLVDVAYDLRHIIETTKIKQIHSALDPEQLKFLKSLSLQKEGLAFKRMGLDKWEGDVSYLQKLIHQRGLNRLAKALFGQSESLFWYISHKLDVSQASALQQLHTDLNHPQGHALLVQQIVDLCTDIQGDKS